MTACIVSMFQIDACHLITIEGLRDGRKLNPIQQSMVSCHGAQCGFCTPGIVVSLYDLMQDGRPIDDASVRRGLTGNLCRCTGYDSIIHAALQTDRKALNRSTSFIRPTRFWRRLRGGDGAGDHRNSHAAIFKPVTVEQAAQFRAITRLARSSRALPTSACSATRERGASTSP